MSLAIPESNHIIEKRFAELQAVETTLRAENRKLKEQAEKLEYQKTADVNRYRDAEAKVDAYKELIEELFQKIVDKI